MDFAWREPAYNLERKRKELSRGELEEGKAAVPRLSEINHKLKEHLRGNIHQGFSEVGLGWGWRKDETSSAWKSRAAGQLPVTGSITSCLLEQKGEVALHKQQYK